MIFCSCLLAVLILLAIFITHRRQKEKLLLEVDAADDIRENVVFYDEEGAGSNQFMLQPRRTTVHSSMQYRWKKENC